MTDALEGPRVNGPTLSEQANSPRIGRARFIGNGVGFLILFMAISAAISAVHTRLAGGGWVVSLPFFRTSTDLTFSPPSLHIGMIGPNVVADSVLLVVATLLWMDLIVRRRRDRGRSGVDGVVWQVLFLLSQGLYQLHILIPVVRWLDLVLAVGAVYLFVVLVILPGTNGPNRYGPDPRQH